MLTLTPVSRPPCAGRPPRRRLPVVAPLAVAWAVIEEASLWLGEPLPDAWTAWLVHRAEGCIAHARGWRARMRRPGDGGRDLLYVFMRHWLAGRLYADRPDLFAQLPVSYRTGEPLPARPPAIAREISLLSNEARLLMAL